METALLPRVPARRVETQVIDPTRATLQGLLSDVRSILRDTDMTAAPVRRMQERKENSSGPAQTSRVVKRPRWAID